MTTTAGKYQQSEVGKAIDEVLAADPEIREAYRQLMLDGARQMRRLLKFGTTEERTALMRMIIPHAMKAIARGETADENKEMQELYERVVTHVRGA